MEDLPETINKGVQVTEEEEAVAKNERLWACKLNDGQPNYTRYSREEIEFSKLQALEMTREELDVYFPKLVAPLQSFHRQNALITNIKQNPSFRRQTTLFFFLIIELGTNLNTFTLFVRISSTISSHNSRQKGWRLEYIKAKAKSQGMLFFSQREKPL